MLVVVLVDTSMSYSKSRFTFLYRLDDRFIKKLVAHFVTYMCGTPTLYDFQAQYVCVDFIVGFADWTVRVIRFFSFNTMYFLQLKCAYGCIIIAIGFTFLFLEVLVTLYSRVYF